METLIPIVAIVCMFVILPAMFFKFITDNRRAKTLSNDDERSFEEMNVIAARLENRIDSIERILDADHPGWRAKK
jgi:phage shock protein B